MAKHTKYYADIILAISMFCMIYITQPNLLKLFMLHEAHHIHVTLKYKTYLTDIVNEYNNRMPCKSVGKICFTTQKRKGRRNVY